MPIKLNFGGLFFLLSSKKKKAQKKNFELKFEGKKNCNRASPHREKKPNINPKQQMVKQTQPKEKNNKW